MSLLIVGMPDTARRDGVVLRFDSSGFHLYTAKTQAHVAGPLSNLAAAIEEAWRLGAPVIWQQSVDNRGRPLGNPFRLSPPPPDRTS
jgi:hypothetical protein